LGIRKKRFDVPDLTGLTGRAKKNTEEIEIRRGRQGEAASRY